MEPRNATYWNIVTPLEERYILHSGYHLTPEGAICCEKAVSKLLDLGYVVSVELLETVEHELPYDDPECGCSNNFYSKRLCVIIHI